MLITETVGTFNGMGRSGRMSKVIPFGCSKCIRLRGMLRKETCNNSEHEGCSWCHYECSDCATSRSNKELAEGNITKYYRGLVFIVPTMLLAIVIVCIRAFYN